MSKEQRSEDQRALFEANECIDCLRDALKDILLGANMMLEAPVSGAIQRYVAEVKRVAEEALKP